MAANAHFTMKTIMLEKRMFMSVITTRISGTGLAGGMLGSWVMIFAGSRVPQLLHVVRACVSLIGAPQFWQLATTSPLGVVIALNISK